jgi:hypothetical protein
MVYGFAPHLAQLLEANMWSRWLNSRVLVQAIVKYQRNIIVVEGMMKQTVMRFRDGESRDARSLGF